ncbi:hypothetical protein A8713_10725 [Streptomyces sp. SAT1]|nr:hypothetical protein A8713_10725 [Streptomyces sp. SAT1]
MADMERQRLDDGRPLMTSSRRFVSSSRTAVNEATLDRLERGKGRPRKRTLIALLNEYGVDQQQREAISALSDQVDEQGWLRAANALTK